MHYIRYGIILYKSHLPSTETVVDELSSTVDDDLRLLEFTFCSLCHNPAAAEMITTPPNTVVTVQ